MSSLIEENKYKIPNEGRRRVRYALKYTWFVGLLLGASLFSWIWIIIYNGIAATGSLVMGGFTLFVIAFSAFAFWQKYKDAEFSYEVLGVHVTFDSEKYFVPRNLMKTLIKTSVIRPFEQSPYMKENYPEVKGEEITKGMVLRITDERPLPAGHPRLTIGENEDGELVIIHEVTGEEVRVVGVTRFPLKGRPFSEVYGPYGLKSGATGHELRLQAANRLFPFQPEEKDLEWMREQGIID